MSQDPSNIPPPSPPVLHEQGPTTLMAPSVPLVDETTDPALPKADQERAIHIEATEVYYQALERDWEAVAALGLAMDLKHPISAYPLRGEHTPPHVGFLFPYLIAQLILGNSRAALVRLVGMESIVSQHPVFQSLHTVAYALANHSLMGVFPAIDHLESVLHRTHDPRFDAEVKEVALSSVSSLTQTYRTQMQERVGKAYATISSERLGDYLGFTNNLEALEEYVRALGWAYDPTSKSYRPTQGQVRTRGTHLGFDDLNYLATETLALDKPI